MTLEQALALIAQHLEVVCQRCKGQWDVRVYIQGGGYEQYKCPDCTNGKVYPFRKPCLLAEWELGRVQCKDGQITYWNSAPQTCHVCSGKGYLPLEAHQLAEVLWKAGWDVNIDYCFGAGITAIVNKLGYGDSSSGEAHGTDAYYALALATVQALKINIHAS